MLFSENCELGMSVCGLDWALIVVSVFSISIDQVIYVRHLVDCHVNIINFLEQLQFGRQSKVMYQYFIPSIVHSFY